MERRIPVSTTSQRSTPNRRPSKAEQERGPWRPKSSTGRPTSSRMNGMPGGMPTAGSTGKRKALWWPPDRTGRPARWGPTGLGAPLHLLRGNPRIRGPRVSARGQRDARVRVLGRPRHSDGASWPSSSVSGRCLSSTDVHPGSPSSNGSLTPSSSSSRCSLSLSSYPPSQLLGVIAVALDAPRPGELTAAVEAAGSIPVDPTRTGSDRYRGSAAASGSSRAAARIADSRVNVDILFDENTRVL